jgi:hypothetical protein
MQTRFVTADTGPESVIKSILKQVQDDKEKTSSRTPPALSLSALGGQGKVIRDRLPVVKLDSETSSE